MTLQTLLNPSLSTQSEPNESSYNEQFAMQDYPLGNKTVGNFVLLDVIGRGNFSLVRSAAHTLSHKRVAIKMLRKDKTASSVVNKEILIHKMAQTHPNVINLLEILEDQDYFYIIMEHATGGELFDLIEPDVGLEEVLVHFYFKQLLSVLEFLHDLGVCHRDLKPENLLLDDQGQLRLIDFGLATLFRSQGVARMLNTPCGSSVYMAPDVITRAYQGSTVDIWSCGILLYVMLTGTCPWDEPTARCPQYLEYRKHGQHSKIWAISSNLHDEIKELLFGMLCIDPGERWTLARIKSHSWVLRENPLLGSGVASYLKSRMAGMDVKWVEETSNDMETCFSLTQPADFAGPITSVQYSYVLSSVPANCNPHDAFSFSQPSRDGITCTQGAANIPLSSRLTRFFSKEDKQRIFKVIAELLEGFLVSFKANPSPLKIHFSTVDRRKCPMSGNIGFKDVGKNQCLVLFVKTKGDVMEFKRFFKLIFSTLVEQNLVDLSGESQLGISSMHSRRSNLLALSQNIIS